MDENITREQLQAEKFSRKVHSAYHRLVDAQKILSKLVKRHPKQMSEFILGLEESQNVLQNGINCVKNSVDSVEEYIRVTFYD
jgi:hypothetical protein